MLKFWAKSNNCLLKQKFAATKNHQKIRLITFAPPSKSIFNIYLWKYCLGFHVSKVKTTNPKGSNLKATFLDRGVSSKIHGRFQNFLRPFRSKRWDTWLLLWIRRGVICGEMVGIGRQLDTITFISPRVAPGWVHWPPKNKSFSDCISTA